MGPATMAQHPALDLTICQIQKPTKVRRTGKSKQKYTPEPRQEMAKVHILQLLKDSLVKALNLLSRWYSSEYGTIPSASPQIPRLFDSPSLRLCQLPVLRTAWHKLVVFWLSILRWWMVGCRKEIWTLWTQGQDQRCPTEWVTWPGKWELDKESENMTTYNHF